MSQIRPLTEQEFPAFVSIVANAYPTVQLVTDDDRERFTKRLLTIQNEDETSRFLGLFRDEQLLGGMRFHDYVMNMRSTRIKVGGVALVAVDLIHKKEHVAKELITHFLEQYRAQGVNLTALYPFRPDFYKKMGFGTGTKINKYRLLPSALPKTGSKQHLAYLTADDRSALQACHRRYVAQTHGMFDKTEFELNNLMNIDHSKCVVYKKDGAIHGYLTLQFQRDEARSANDLLVREVVYESPEVLASFMTFLNSQADQFGRVIFNTTDEHFHYLPLDARNDTGNSINHLYFETNTSGIGLMYRVINTAGLFAELQGHRFAPVSLRVKLTLDDSFLPQNAGSTILDVREGLITVVADGPYDVEMRIDISDFSSLLVGAVDLRSLYRYSLAHLSDPTYLPQLHQLFSTESKPICTTLF